MSRSINSILRDIDSLPIYKDDFDIIKNILNVSNPKLFASIIESVLSDDLYWSDFIRILDDINYSDTVANILKTQKEIKDKCKKLLELRKSINFGTSDEEIIENLIITDTDSSENSQYYNEYILLRDEIINEITKINKNDTELSILCKIRMYNDIKNNNINPDDIFFFIHELVIPVDSENQIITVSDRIFMEKNNITEEQLKKYKSVAIFLRGDWLSEKSDQSNGG